MTVNDPMSEKADISNGNGTSASNGQGQGQTAGDGGGDGKYHGFDSAEITRLVIQTLHGLGYENAAQTLEADSGLSIETAQVLQFRDAIAQGSWQEAEDLLDGLEITSVSDRTEISFRIRRQQYLELLELQRMPEALAVLRTRLTPLNSNKDELHNLSRLLMSSIDDIKATADWDGAKGQSRTNLFLTLQAFLPASVTLSPHRLATLLEQAQNLQFRSSNYWMDPAQPFSLYKNFVGDRRYFPTTTKRVLEHHDEVWFLEFSHNGKYLASCSADKRVIIWDVEKEFAVHTVLHGHTRGIIYLSWSWDDRYLLSSGEDGRAVVWDVLAAESTRVVSEHTEIVGACSWMPNSLEFITGSPDKQLLLWGIEGKVIHRFPGIRVMNLAVTPDAKKLVVLSNKKVIHVFDLETKDQITEIQMHQELTSVTISKDSKYALINVKPDEVHLWDLNSYRIVRKYVGQLQKEFVIRSCFGGVDEQFVLSGSQDNHVYVWNRHTAELIETLPGHRGSVNCVRWSPTHPRMFASAGDDGKIRIWGPQVEAETENGS